MREPSDYLKLARRSLDTIPQCKIFSDWQWNDALERWALGLEVTMLAPVRLPPTTRWYLLCMETYPWGEIAVFPAAVGGLEESFPHQLKNNVLKDFDFRAGKICLSEPISGLSRVSLGGEPFAIAERLRWHINRLLEWLDAADLGNLAKAGDHFELPDFAAKAKYVFAFNEDGSTLQTWQKCPAISGFASVAKLNSSTFIVRRFFARDRFSLHVTWGHHIIGLSNEQRALWVRLPSLPTIKSWEIPTTWGELFDVCTQKGVPLLTILESSVDAFRDNEKHLLLIGFPIPDIIGESPVVVHWQAILLPVLASGTKAAIGFRSASRKRKLREKSRRKSFSLASGEQGYWRNDRGSRFKDSEEIDWITSENWHPRAILARGAVIDELRNCSVILIGAGALGSRIAEQLVRMGLVNMTIVDNDRMHAGNLARHTLDLTCINENKALAVANWLNTLSPHARVRYVAGDLRTASKEGQLSNGDVILDCTGSDQVLAELAVLAGDKVRFYASLSLSFAAKKLFCFASMTRTFPHDLFVEMTNQTLQNDAMEHSDLEVEWEGVGCWHPLFPARIDKISQLASMGIRWLEGHFRTNLDSPVFEVIES